MSKNFSPVPELSIYMDNELDRYDLQKLNYIQ
jgi:hypothetical protein